MLTYKCPTCGFVYQVPAYWSDFSAEENLEMDHVDLKNQEACANKMLEIVK